MDKEFDSAIKQYIHRTSDVKKTQGGRPPLDKGDKSWQIEFCKALYKNDGNREKASKVTPYDFDTIYTFLSQSHEYYDEDFARKVRITELKIAAKAEEMVLSLLDPSNFATVDDSRISQTKAWVGMKILEKLDKDRYGKEIGVKHSGTVKHELVSRESAVARLVEEQKNWMQSNQKYLQAETDSANVIDITPTLVHEPIQAK